MTDLAAATTETARIVAGVRDDQLTDPTPCPGTSVAAMIDHLSGLAVAFRMAAEKVRPGGGPSADAATSHPTGAPSCPPSWRSWPPPGARRGHGKG